MSGKTRNTRSLIRKAARAEFAEHGYAGARVARIAAGAGVNKQLIFYYFRSKRGLFEAVMQGAIEEMGSSIANAGSGMETFRAAFAAMFANLAESPELTNLLFRERADPERLAVIERLVGSFDRLVAEGQGLGYFRDDLDPDFAARQTVAMLIAFFAMEEVLFQPIERHRERWLKEIGALLIDWLTW